MESALSCERIDREEYAERYAAGKLPEPEAEAFEEHFFRCAACLARLEAAQETAVILRTGGAVRRLSYTGLAMAACLLVALGAALFWARQPEANPPPAEVARLEPPPPNALAELGRFDAPIYHDAVLRGAAERGSAEFTSGIAAYQKHDYTAAAASLSKAAEANPRDARAAFFAGVSLLLSGDTAGGLDALRRTDGLGLTPYQEEARFYQAKALLLMGDAAGARQVLQRVVAMHGDWESTARDILARLPR